jgi:MoaA/NifB/PqqE/SkfB family radical SAM enzyme
VPEIVEAVGRYHFPFLTTNGWLVTAETARDLMRAGLWGASVSIDYADADRHDRRRGMAGAWEQAWRAVELFSEARIHSWQRVNVIAVLMDDNLDDVEPLLRMSAERGAYFMVQPYGQLKTGSAGYAHNNGPVAPRLLDLRRRYRNFLSNPTYLSRFDAYHQGGIPGCRAGRAFFNIDETGDVAVCVERRSQPVGNLFRDDLRDLLARLKADGTGNQCRGCWYNCRGEVESLYHPMGVLQSLPTLLLDRGRAR